MTARTIRAARVFALAAWLSAVAATLAAQQQRPDSTPVVFSIDDVLSAPFAKQLIVSRDGGRIAWLGYEEGRRNVWTATAPSWTARKVTRYTEDDGQELDDLAFSADGRWLLYTRGGDGGGNSDETRPANPTSDPRGMEQAVYAVSVTGATPPRRLGAGHRPLPSPDGSKVAWLYQDTVYTGPLRVAGPPRVLFRMRGAAADLAWSPDGSRLAFTSDRDSHSFVGVYDARHNRVTWMTPSTNHDVLPKWSPDGSQLAYIREPGSLYRTGPRAPTAPPPGPPAYSIMIADAETGMGGAVYTSTVGFPGQAVDFGLMWAGDRLVFASEETGWVGMYSMPAAGGAPIRLTPTGCEAQDVTLGADDALYYASNCEDIDRRHLWRVPVAGGSPERLTSGTGIEWSPVAVMGGRVAMLRSTVRRPAAPAMNDTATADSAGIPALDGWPLPDRFPIDALVAPEQVVVKSSDSLDIHLQVFSATNMPPGRRPAIIFFHGGPSREMLLGWHYMQYYHNAYAMNQYLASRGFIVVSVNYRGGVGYGRAFRTAPRRGSFGGSEYLDVLAAAAYLRSRPDVDSASIGLWGGSYGGYLTALGLARNSDLFSAGVDFHGVHDYAEERHLTSTWGVTDSVIAVARAASAVADVAKWTSPVLLIQGDDDRNVEFQQTVDLARRLELLGVDVQELIFPDEIHDFLRHESWVRAYRAGAAFLAAKVRRVSAP